MITLATVKGVQKLSDGVHGRCPSQFSQLVELEQRQDQNPTDMHG